MPRIFAATALTFVVIAGGACASDESRAATHLARGKEFLANKDYQSARIELSSSVRLSPRVFDAYYHLAQAQLALQDWVGASGSLDRAVTLEPEKLDLRLMRGQFYLAAREYARAEEDARFVIGKEPSNVAAQQLLGGALAGQQLHEDALDAFAKVAQLAPSDPSAFVNLGIANVSLRRFESAAGHFEKALQLEPKAVTAWLNLAGMFRMQGKPAQAVETMRRSIQANPNAIDLYITLAELLENEPGGESEATLNRLRAQAPGSRDAALALGNYFSRRDKQQEAIAEYSRGLAAAPQDLELRKRLLDGYLAVGDLAKAGPLNEALMKEAPTDIAVRTNHARWLTATSKIPEAIVVLQKVVDDAPQSPQGHYFLGMAYWKLGDANNLALARRELNSALEFAPDYRAAVRSSVALYLAMGDLNEAENLSRRHLRQFPADSTVRVSLGQAYLARRRIADARREFQAALKLTPNDPVAAASLGQTYAAEQNWAEAERQLEAAMAIDPRNTRTLGQLADFWAARNQPQKAVERLQRFLKSYPEVAEAHLFLGAAEMAVKNFPAAQIALERAIQLDGGLMAAYVRLGQIYQQQGKTREAIARYEKGLEAQPGQVQLCTLIGNLYLAEGNLDMARKFYERALSIDRNFGVASGNLAWIHLQQNGNLDVALDLAQEAVARHPDVVPMRDTLGWILYKKNQKEQALPHLEECVKRAPDVALYRYHLAKTQILLGRTVEAKQNFDEAMRLKLTGPEADDARVELAKWK